MDLSEQQAGLFARFGNLMQSGVPLLRALEVAATRVRDPALQTALERILKRSYGGSPISESFAREAPLFTESVICLLKHGEEMGDIDRKCLAIAEGLKEGIYDAGGATGVEASSEACRALIETAIAEGASDVHIDPTISGARVRFRKEGKLVFHKDLTRAETARLLKSAKARAGLEDGGEPEIAMVLEGERYVRLSTCRYDLGDGLTLRLLPAEPFDHDLAGVQMSEADAATVRGWLGTLNGILVVTGPAGCGKTTTAHAMLLELDREDSRVVTIERQPHHRIPDVHRVVLGSGDDRGDAISAQLNSDVDAVFVDVLDDGSIAGAIDAALTGHLVITTTTARSAVGALLDLLETDVSGTALAESVRGIVAQRLVRRAGGKGRAAVQEVLSMTPALRKALRSDPTRETLEAAARGDGLVPLADRAAEMVKAGVLDAADAERLLGSQA